MSDMMQALADIDQEDTAAYYTAVYLAAHEAVIAVGNGDRDIQMDLAGNPGRAIKYRPEVIMDALAAVCASFVVQSGEYPDAKAKRLAADVLRSRFVKQLGYFEKEMAKPGAGILAHEGQVN